MIDSSLELQKAIIAVLRADASVTDLVGNKIYDDVPSTVTKPYISLSMPTVTPDQADCIDGAEVIWQVDGWASGPKSVQIKLLGGAIASALDGMEPVMTGHRMVLCQIEQVQYLNDPDPVTKHVAVVVRAVTEPKD